MQAVVSKKSKAPAFASLTVLFYTYFLGSMFVGGDQLSYRAVYELVSGLGFLEGYLYYKTIIVSDELGHYIVIWLASHVIDKDVLNAFSNALLAYFSVKIFIEWGARPFIAFFLVVFGYYHLALFLSAERLKYASIFFVLGIYSFKTSRASYLFFIFALITHLQYIILIASGLLVKAADTSKQVFTQFKFRAKDGLFLLVAVAALSSLLLIFGGHIERKILSYYQNFGIIEFVRIAAFFLMSLWYAKNKSQAALVFGLLFLTVGLVGGMRVNIFGYFVFLFYSLRVNRGLNFGVLITFLYFFAGWLEYSYQVYSCGVNRPC